MMAKVLALPIPKTGNRFIMLLEGKAVEHATSTIPCANFIVLMIDFSPISFWKTENMEFARTTNTRRYWHCADFVAAFSGHRQDIHALPINLQTFELAYRKHLAEVQQQSPNSNQYHPHSFSNIFHYKWTETYVHIEKERNTMPTIYLIVFINYLIFRSVRCHDFGHPNDFSFSQIFVLHTTPSAQLYKPLLADMIIYAQLFYVNLQFERGKFVQEMNSSSQRTWIWKRNQIRKISKNNFVLELH